MAPLISYRDLNADDIAMLTEVLDHRSASRVHALIDKLPSRLRSKVPCMAPGCHLHKRLNVMPLDDLARAFRYEVSVHVRTIWDPLRAAGVLDDSQLEMLGALSALTTLPRSHCSACWLEYANTHRNAMLALGAVTIGRVNPNIYQKSKRLLFIEDCIRDAMEQPLADAQIRRMWDAGVELRKVRKWAALTCSEDRGHVAEYVRRAKDMDVLPRVVAEPAKPRPSQMPTNATEDGLRNVPEHHPAEANVNLPERLVRRKPVPEPTKPPPRATPRPDNSPLLPPSYSPGPYHQARASSVYSQAPSAIPSHTPGKHTSKASSTPSWWNYTGPSPARPDDADDEDLIDLYRHSVFPKVATFDDPRCSSTDSRKRSPMQVWDQPNPTNVRNSRETQDDRRDSLRPAPLRQGPVWTREPTGLGLYVETGMQRSPEDDGKRKRYE